MRQLLIVLVVLVLTACTTPTNEPVKEPIQKLKPSQAVKENDAPKFDFIQLKVRYQPPAPEYPQEVKALGIQGTVVVELVIDPNGLPIKAVATSGPSELRAYTEAFAMQWRFIPAFLEGKPQYARFRLTVPYKLN
jgi:TonB family protein